MVAGIAVLIGAGFFGYMLALLQRRVGVMVSSQNVSISLFLLYLILKFLHVEVDCQTSERYITLLNLRCLSIIIFSSSYQFVS